MVRRRKIDTPDDNGQRAGSVVFDLADSSQIPLDLRIDF